MCWGGGFACIAGGVSCKPCLSCKPGQVCALTGYPEGETHLAAQTPLFRGFEPCYPPGVLRAQLGGGRNRRVGATDAWAQQTGRVRCAGCGVGEVGGRDSGARAEGDVWCRAWGEGGHTCFTQRPSNLRDKHERLHKTLGESSVGAARGRRAE